MGLQLSILDLMAVGNQSKGPPSWEAEEAN